MLQDAGKVLWRAFGRDRIQLSLLSSASMPFPRGSSSLLWPPLCQDELSPISLDFLDPESAEPWLAARVYCSASLQKMALLVSSGDPCSLSVARCTLGLPVAKPTGTHSPRVLRQLVQQLGGVNAAFRVFDKKDAPRSVFEQLSKGHSCNPVP